MVAVLAHNEEHKIIDCLQSLDSAAGNHPYDAYVLANGCTDNTEVVVRNFIKNKPHLHLVSIEKGDKCNAWNVFVHEVHAAADLYFFIDGDVTAADNALLAMSIALERQPDAIAGAALPITGRSVETQKEIVRREHGMAGNLYVLRKEFINNMRQQNLRLPIGIVGDDSLLGALVMWNLNPSSGWRKENVVVCDEAGFAFESMSPFLVDDWRVQWKRMKRYSRRYFENSMLREILRNEGIGSMPETNIDLYRRKLHECRLRWRGLWTVFDFLALREMEKVLRSR